jgi:hypothetical protein
MDIRNSEIVWMYVTFPWSMGSLEVVYNIGHPDLKPLAFCLRGYMKDLVYQQECETQNVFWMLQLIYRQNLA